MNTEERREILIMLSEGKITVDEADMLLDAVEEATADEAKASQRANGVHFDDFGLKFNLGFDQFDNMFGRFDDFFGKSAKRKDRPGTGRR